MSGKLIVFEGVEGCGKTTQIKRTQEWLQSQTNTPVVITREPGGTTLGIALRHLLLSIRMSEDLIHDSTDLIHDTTELLLYAADRAQHVNSVLKPELARGSIVLCDRYTDSTIAYQGYGRGMSLSLIAQLNQIATGGLESDLTLWLDVDVEVGLARKRALGVGDRIEQEDIAFHQRVRQGYAELAKSDSKTIARIDALLSEIEVQEGIQWVLSNPLIRLFQSK